MRIYPVILCGGSGTRLWPASRSSRPKQFIGLLGDESLFQQTVERVLGLEEITELIIVAGEAHREWVSSQLPGTIDQTIIIEPEGRDSAPAIAAATAYIHAKDPDGVAVILSSDHFIPDAASFCKGLRTAAQAAAKGRIVTLGIVPTEPTTAYGYICAQESDAPVKPVKVFKEKPDRETAIQYIEDGYFWNSGNFIYAVSTMHDELNAHAPEVLSAAKLAVSEAQTIDGVLRLGDSFRQAPKISIDFAVIEKTKLTSVLPLSLDWSDLGAWDAVKKVTPANAQGNNLVGDAISIDCKNSYIRAENGMVAAVVGVENLAVIVEPDAVLVAPLDRAQDVKPVVEALRDGGHLQARATSGPVPAARLPKSLATIADDYRQWLHTAALPLWWSLGGDHSEAGWGFEENLSMNGAPTGADRRARVQARQTYVYALAGSGAAGFSWSGPWGSAVRHGFEGLERQYRRDDGLYRTLVGADGGVLDDTAYLYDQTFILLALSAARSIVPDASERAADLLSVIEKNMRYSAGGFKEAGDQPFQSNAHMHLLESALGWLDSTDDSRSGPWYGLAEEIAALAMAKFIDDEGGFLREFFNDQWAPASGLDGTIVEPGHQFEWAWLLVRWAEKSGDKAVLAAAHQLYLCGLMGVDPKRNVAVDTLNERLQPQTSRARLWPQTEWLKAALRLADHSDGPQRQSLLNDAKRAASGLSAYLDVEPRGLWLDKSLEDGSFADEPASGSSFYHIIAAIGQLASSSR